MLIWIYHFIVSKNMFDCIINNLVVHDICNINWKKASYENIAEYKSHLDEKLMSIKLSNDTYNCDDVHCKSITLSRY